MFMQPVFLHIIKYDPPIIHTHTPSSENTTEAWNEPHSCFIYVGILGIPRNQFKQPVNRMGARDRKGMKGYFCKSRNIHFSMLK